MKRNEVKGLNQITEKQHIKEIDIIRGLACMAVIFVHLTAGPINELTPGSPAMLLLLALNRALKFTIPVLLFVSGFLLMHAYENRDYHRGNFFLGRMKKLFWPYLTWSLIYGTAFVYFGLLPFDPMLLLKKFFLADLNYHMYFVAVLFQCYVLFELLRRCLKRFNPLLILGISLVVNVFFIAYGNFPYADRFVLKYLFFFVLGMYIAMDWKAIFAIVKRQKHWVLGVYFGTAVLYGMHYYSKLVDDIHAAGHVEPLTWFFFCLASLPMLYLGAQRIQREHAFIAKWLIEISGATFYIYLAHPFVLYGVQYGLNQIGLHGLLDRLLVEGALVYGITLTAAIGYNRLKRTWVRQ